MAVRRMREDEERAPGDARKRAVIRFALWETAGFVPLVLWLVWLYILGPERPGGEAATLSMIAAAAFVIYVGILFVLILLPVLKGRDDAR